ncbi:MAG: ribonuclease III [Gammaproteobacteria bacterium]|nr:MAG: ribonuclease III [Gammaproteobacteria bacterium TMED236]|tara:strand:- start:4086 stop:4736 length:651 start_codon:yes stop_codon:yes gene_type:complete
MSASSIEVDKSYLELPLMKQAFIHKSVSSAQNNERLEFLGDAVLEIVVSEYLFNRFDKLDEGRLTQMRASLVNTQSLSKIFLQLDCRDLLQTSIGTKKLDETHKYSIYAGALEACIGAIFVELGFEESKSFILYLFQDSFSLLNESIELKDAKSRLQEALQALGVQPPNYLVASNKEGNNFNCNVTFDGKTFSASASIKKESEQRVAELILLELNQ